MAVASMERARIERLAVAIADDLKTRSYAQALVEDVGDVEEWRRAARLAGRRLRWRVRTSVPYGIAVCADAIDMPTPQWVVKRDEAKLAKKWEELSAPKDD
jgi:hypothetical protein